MEICGICIKLTIEISDILSILSLIIALIIYSNQCKHIYNINYSKILYSNIENDIIKLKSDTISTIDTLLDDIEILCKDRDDDEIEKYIVNISCKLSKYINVISEYILCMKECNQYKHRLYVNNCIKIFENANKKLKQLYNKIEIKTNINNTVNLMLNLSEYENYTFYSSIIDGNINIESFKEEIIKLKHSILNVEQFKINGYTICISDIGRMFNKHDTKYKEILKAYKYIIKYKD